MKFWQLEPLMCLEVIPGMIAVLLFSLFAATAGAQIFTQELLFPTENWHNHSSSIVELPNADLLVAWYHGSGEGEADDVCVMGMRKSHRTQQWSEPFLMVDTPNLPDLNPVLFLDPRGVLWLFRSTYMDNSIKGCLIKYCTSSDYNNEGAPKWEWQEVLHVRPRNFETIYAIMQQKIEQVREDDIKKNPKLRKIIDEQQSAVRDKLLRRLGWMTRTRPTMTTGNQLMLGIYHDLFACGLAAFTEDWGATWTFSEPIVDVYLGLVQPTFALRKDGSIVSFLRDNGFPKQIRSAISLNSGIRWRALESLDIPNPGSSVDCLVLKNGHWVLCCNDLKEGRHRLTVYLSENEGKSWHWRRSFAPPRETVTPQADRPSLPESATWARKELHYPTMIQGQDGTIHATYSYGIGSTSTQRNESICYVHFDEEWIRQGEKLN
ncbi:exo-alpha-sialidase [candidate division KSB1 bacterium]|nr:exo-alpha-sialidase [candidate division KSB1 bacterium]